MKKKFSIILALVLILSLVACGSKEENQVDSVKVDAEVVEENKEMNDMEEFDEVEVNVAFMPNMGSGSSLITAMKMGYFEEVGLNVKTKEFQGGPAEIAAMASGDIDISQIGHGAHALAVEGEAKIFGIDQLGISDEVLANKSLGIEKPEDLKGKTVASTAGTSAEIVLELVLKEAGLTKNDLTIVEMDANGAVSAMVSGKVDAVATWAPSTNIIKEKMGEDVVVLGSNADYIDEVTFPGSFITTEKYANENRDVLVRFEAAIMKAQDYREPNIEEVATWLAEAVEADPEIMVETKDSALWLTGEFISEALKDRTIEKYYEGQQRIFIDNGRITEEVPVEDYVLFDIMNEANDLYLKIK